MPRDPNEDARMLAQVEAIFDQRGLTPEERETVGARLTALLVKGLDGPVTTALDRRARARLCPCAPDRPPVAGSRPFAHDVEAQRHDGGDQENVNQASADVKCKEPERPSDK